MAPGVNIKSTWLRKGVKTISGTSMASPHVAGVMTLWLSIPEWSDLSPAEMKAKLQSSASTGYLTDLLESPDFLLFSAPPLSANATAMEAAIIEKPNVVVRSDF